MRVLYLNKQAVTLLFFCLWGTSIISIEQQQEEQTLKKVPLRVVDSFLKKKLGNRVKIINGQDVLVPTESRVIFSLNVEQKKILIQGFTSDGSKETYKEFSFEQPQSNKIIFDINSGSRLSLILKQRYIVIQLTGRALESGSVGDIIRVRVANLANNFRVRIISKKQGMILL